MGRTIIPTLEAEILYPRALAILDDLEKLKEDLTAVGQSISGDLILAASTIPSAYILPRLAANFKRKYPGISFEIKTFDSGNVIDSVLNNEILLGIVGAKSSSPKLSFTPFVEDELVLAASVERKISQRITHRTLAELPFIMREVGSGTRKCVEEFLGSKEISTDDLNITAVLGSSTAVTEAIKANLGVSILSRHAVQEAVERDQIQIIDILNLEMVRHFYIVTARKRTLPHHYEAFFKSLVGNKKS